VRGRIDRSVIRPPCERRRASLEECNMIRSKGASILSRLAPALLPILVVTVWMGMAPSALRPSQPARTLTPVEPATPAAEVAGAAQGARSYDPLEKALATAGVVNNLEAVIPPQCYTRTDGISNPCWTCHAVPVAPNFMIDWDLQEEYAFSDFGLTNHWTNLFVDRTPRISAISDQEILDYIHEDNYTALRTALVGDPRYPGFIPDLDFTAGFDADGFARDGSEWRALRFKSFLGTFWPTNGNRNDVFIRLPAAFWRDAAGTYSRAVYKLNLAILEAAVTSETPNMVGPLDRVVEPVDEALAGFDLNADGIIGGLIMRVRQLPPTYAGGASGVAVARNLYPENTEFLHTVRYVDPDHPSLLAPRMKEVRYSRKLLMLDLWAIQRIYEKDLEDREQGVLPAFSGDALHGLVDDFMWLYQGFIEDAQGRLRLQTDEEHRFCMGCHGAIGINVDHSFAFPRKVPGFRGWREQDIRGIPDVPQAGTSEPETLSYFARVQGGDEFRGNDEILARFFPGGVLDTGEVLRAAVGGDRDLFYLVAPTRARALLLDKAYKALVEDNTFELGRDGVAAPVQNVFPEITGNGETELGAAGLIFPFGRLHLAWSGVAVVPGDVDGDDDSDVADWLALSPHVHGPALRPAPDVTPPVLFDAADQDGDGDIDLHDVALLGRTCGTAGA
jgi:hypothetical protein